MGGINAIAAKLLSKLNMPKKMTIKPTALKNTPDLPLLWMLKELKLKRASAGNVPKAKINMFKAPLKKLPVVRV